jgi:hypothetical protein
MFPPIRLVVFNLALYRWRRAIVISLISRGKAKRASRAPSRLRPMVIRYSGLAGTLTYRSFYAAATWTNSEGERTLRRVRYREPPEGVFLGGGTGRECVQLRGLDKVCPGGAGVAWV